MSEDSRHTSLVGALWFFSALVLTALFISAAAQQELTRGHILLACVILAIGVGGTPLLLRWAERETPRPKAKRRDIDSLLQDMSVEEFLELKQRLADTDISEESISNYLGDDGELVRRR